VDDPYHHHIRLAGRFGKEGKFVEVANLENEVLAVVRSTGFERATFSVRGRPHVGGTTSSRGAVGTLTAASAIEQRDNERPLLTPI
jgi:hypothetical protein